MKKISIDGKEYVLTKAVSSVEDHTINFEGSLKKEKRNVVKLYLPYPVTELKDMNFKNYCNWKIIEINEVEDPETHEKKTIENVYDHHAKYTHLGDIYTSQDGTIVVCMCELTTIESYGSTVNDLLKIIQNLGGKQ